MLTLLVILLALILTLPSLSSKLYSDKSEEGGTPKHSLQGAHSSLGFIDAVLQL